MLSSLRRCGRPSSYEFPVFLRLLVHFFVRTHRLLGGPRSAGIKHATAIAVDFPGIALIRRGASPNRDAGRCGANRNLSINL